MTDEEVQVEETMETPVEELIDTPVETPAEEISETPVEESTEPSSDESQEVPTEEETTTEGELTEDGISSELESVETPEEGLLVLEEEGWQTVPLVRTFTVTTPDVLASAQSDNVSASMADVITSVLGEYQRMTYTVEEYDTDGNLLATSVEYVPGLAGLDYAWITGALLFGLLISGGLKLLGRLFG